MRIGLFGGTFDPPHIGHLIVAQDAADALGLDRVLFVPAGLPPHKRGREITAAPTRLELTRAAVGDDPRFAVDDRELRRTGPSYTVDTLEALAAEAPEDELVLLVGADQYAAFDTWRDVDRIRMLATVAVLDREGGAGPVTAGDRRIAVTRIDLSASEIRDRVRNGRSIRYLVPEPVEAVIRAHDLYVQEIERRNGEATPG